MKRVFGLIAVVVSFILGVGSASAATLNVSGGQLLGASGVIVDGIAYNVEFQDGTCIDLFSGCDESADFTFTSMATGALASQALFDQVFIDGVFPFDSDPSRTNGCADPSFCWVMTPYEHLVGPNANASITANRSIEATDEVFSIEIFTPSSTDATGGGNWQVYAVWSPVPEPNTALLMLLGLTGLGWQGRSKRA